ncbi:MAG: hypothetical protein H6590_05120 [Flavobacteriales bacterium]|nr:hypothetical protein [Flavobacteriales bacterium]MCB9178785.1 hypothetical protein [Flavobacteriales bacterium]HPF90719.1 hypothetical protein [Flavobacteriales bacterium]
MSQGPFKIIRPSDEPPAELRKEVMGSVKLMMLMMRFMQLFMADYAGTIFENFRIVGRRNERDGMKGQSSPEPPKT